MSSSESDTTSANRAIELRNLAAMQAENAFVTGTGDKPAGVSDQEWLAYKQQQKQLANAVGQGVGTDTTGPFADWWKRALSQEKYKTLTKEISGRSGTILGNSTQTQDASKIGKTILSLTEATKV